MKPKEIITDLYNNSTNGRAWDKALKRIKDYGKQKSNNDTTLKTLDAKEYLKTIWIIKSPKSSFKIEDVIELMQEYAEHYAQSQWIKCSDRLPEEDGRYLIFYKFSNMINGKIFISDWDSFNEDWTRLIENVEITHWQQIPKIPKS